MKKEMLVNALQPEESRIAIVEDSVLEELYIDEHFEELLGRAPGDLRPGQYARAIAVALIIRHSWHPDDLACILKRLKLRVGHA